MEQVLVLFILFTGSMVVTSCGSKHPSESDHPFKEMDLPGKIFVKYLPEPVRIIIIINAVIHFGVGQFHHMGKKSWYPLVGVNVTIWEKKNKKKIAAKCSTSNHSRKEVRN